MERDRWPLKGATCFRAADIEQLRIALNEGIASQDLYFEQDGEKSVGLPEAFRILLGLDGINWRNSTTAESVMVVAQRAIDDELAQLAGSTETSGKSNPATGLPWTWQDRLRSLIGLFVSLERQDDRPRSHEAIESKIWDDLELAFGDEPSANWVTTVAVPWPDGIGTEQQEVVACPGLFRMVLWNEDVNWYEPDNKALAKKVIREILAAELT